MSEDLKLLPCICGSTDIHTYTDFAEGIGSDWEVMECRDPACKWQVRAINPEALRPAWNRRVPGPATAKMLEWVVQALKCDHYRLNWGDRQTLTAFLAESEPRSEKPPDSR